MESRLDKGESEAREGCLSMKKHEGEQMEVSMGWKDEQVTWRVSRGTVSVKLQMWHFLSRVFPWEGGAEVEGRR